MINLYIYICNTNNSKQNNNCQQQQQKNGGVGGGGEKETQQVEKVFPQCCDFWGLSQENR